jgi:nucleoside-diphosphate-sugar epimerase
MGRAFIFGIENQDKMINNIYNIGSDKMNYSKEQICEFIRNQTKAYIHYADVGEDADKRNYRVSYNKINKLGYSTTINVEEGIHELVKVCRAIEFRNPYSNI